jgi:hypothetical protein
LDYYYNGIRRDSQVRRRKIFMEHSHSRSDASISSYRLRLEKVNHERHKKTRKNGSRLQLFVIVRVFRGLLQGCIKNGCVQHQPTLSVNMVRRHYSFSISIIPEESGTRKGVNFPFTPGYRKRDCDCLRTTSPPGDRPGCCRPERVRSMR